MHRVARGEALARRGAHLDHRDRARVGTPGNQAADQRARHVAPAEEGNSHAALFSFFLCPKMAVPTRTMVAPSAMARSMSSDMPMERVSKPNSPFNSSNTTLAL